MDQKVYTVLSSNHNPEGLAWKNWVDPHEYVNRKHFGSRFMLMGVDLKVQDNNYRRDVPMISLTSKLNGHAIIGHPIQVEVLETGSSANLLPATDYFYPESLESPTGLSPVWRTGRRTANSRFRRLRPTSVGDGDNKQFEKRLLFGTEHGSFGPKPIQTKMSHPSSKQKIRSLSSIASEQKLHLHLRKSIIL